MNWITLIALGIGFVVGIILIPVFIPILKKLKFGQQVREDGPQAHLKKSGIPTMGGICIIIAMLIGSLVFVGADPAFVLPVAITTFLYALIGFLDDFLKIKKHQSEGLKAWQKMALQIIFMVALMLYVALGTPNGTSTMIPFYGMVDLKGWFYPIAILAILGRRSGRPGIQRDHCDRTVLYTGGRKDQSHAGSGITGDDRCALCVFDL